MALFIESAIVGQFMLMSHSRDGAAIEQNHRVIERVTFADQRAHNHRGPAVAGRAGQTMQLDRGLCRERRFFDHVLRRVADQLHLRKNDQVDVARFGPFAQHGIGVAAEVADALRHLGECDLKVVGHSSSLARLRRLGNARYTAMKGLRRDEIIDGQFKPAARASGCRLSRNSADQGERAPLCR